MLPDADVLSFKFGLAYGNVFGHRGFTHSLVFAFVVPLLCVLIGRRWFRAGLIRCWLFFNRLVAIAQLAGFGNHWR